jgi:site-specific DNA recombinase
VGVKRIAAELNEHAAAAPMPRRAGRPRGWAPSSVREVLHRELYAGRILWNRTAKVIRGGAKHQRDRAPEELVTVEAPELRIVPEEVWRAARERMAAGRALYFAGEQGARLRAAGERR